MQQHSVTQAKLQMERRLKETRNLRRDRDVLIARRWSRRASGSAETAQPLTSGSALQRANQVVMFILELAAYSSAAYRGLTLDLPLLVRILTALAAVTGLVVVWWWFGAPKARWPARGLGRIMLEALWFGIPFSALASTGLQALAATLAVVFGINALLRAPWRPQRSA